MWTTVWGKTIGTILGFLGIALITSAVSHMFAFWEVQAAATASTEAIVKMKEGEEKRQETLDAILTAVGGLKEQYEELKGIILTPVVVGRATVGDFGFDDSFLDINERGNANMYLSAHSVMVTYSMNGTELKLELTVRGSFRNQQDGGHLAILSAKAGSDMGVSVGTIMDKFTVGPVNEDAD